MTLVWLRISDDMYVTACGKWKVTYWRSAGLWRIDDLDGGSHGHAKSLRKARRSAQNIETIRSNRNHKGEGK